MNPLDGVAAFVSAVETGSFSAAARRLGLSRSAVGAHVQRIEERLGAQLIHRMTRTISLTEIGAVYYKRCVLIVAEAKSAERLAQSLKSQSRDVLSISVPESFGPLHVTPAISEFLQRFPNLLFDILLARQGRQSSEGPEAPDLAIRFGSLKDSPLVVRRLAPLRFVFCASPVYLKMRGEPRGPEDLPHHDCLGVRDMPWSGDSGLFVEREKKIESPRVLCSDSADILRTATLIGLGIALLPSWIVGQDIRDGALKRILRGYETQPSALFAAYPGNGHRANQVRAFVEHLAQRIGRAPYWDSDL